MKKEDLFEAMSSIENDLLERSERSEKRRGFAYSLASVAAVFALVILAAVGINSLNSISPALVQTESQTQVTQAQKELAPEGDYNGVKMQYSDGKVGFAQPDLAYLSEEDIFTADSERVFNNGTQYPYQGGSTIFMGTVTRVQNITLNFGSYGVDWKGDWIENCAIVEIRVEKVYRGNVSQGDTVQVFAPYPVANTNLWVEDCENSGCIKEGTRGIFMPFELSGQYMEKNGKKVKLNDFAQYRFVFWGDRDYFFEGDNGIVYSEFAFESLKNPQTLEDVERYVLSQIS